MPVLATFRCSARSSNRSHSVRTRLNHVYCHGPAGQPVNRDDLPQIAASTAEEWIAAVSSQKAKDFKVAPVFSITGENTEQPPAATPKLQASQSLGAQSKTEAELAASSTTTTSSGVTRISIPLFPLATTIRTDFSPEPLKPLVTVFSSER